MHSLILKFDGGFLAWFSLLYRALDNVLKRDLPGYCVLPFSSTPPASTFLMVEIVLGLQYPLDGLEFISLFLREPNFELRN